jgi:hypothetical protein
MTEFNDGISDTSGFEHFCDAQDRVLAAPMEDQNIRESALAAIGYADAYNQREFMLASRGGGGVERWPGLADSTKRKRLRAAGGKGRLSGFDFDFPILYITGELYTSLTQGAPEHYLVVGPNSVRSGTEVFFAHFHQFHEGRNPERRIILRPDTETEEQMVRSIAGGFSLMIQSFL